MCLDGRRIGYRNLHFIVYLALSPPNIIWIENDTLYTNVKQLVFLSFLGDLGQIKSGKHRL